MVKVTPFKELFDVFAEDARELKDVQAAARAHIGNLIDLWVRAPGTSGCARFRGFSFSPSTHKADDGTEQLLLCVRGWNVSGKKIISFSNGPTFELAGFSWLHSCANGELNWKPDEDRRKTGGVNEMLDAIGGTENKG